MPSAGDSQLLGKQFGYAAGSGPALLPRHAGNGVATLMHAQGKGVGPHLVGIPEWLCLPTHPHPAPHEVPIQ